MTTIKAKAYIPSVGEYDALREKFPAFAVLYLSEKALKQGAKSFNMFRNSVRGAKKEERGNFPLRTPCVSSTDKIMCGGYWGACCYKDSSCLTSAGLCISMTLIYNPQSTLVKGCREVSKWAEDVYVKEIKCAKNAVSTAPVVNFGGNDYIWINKEDCENGTSNVMSCISIELLEKAKPFDEDGDHNDYAKAEELRAQCEKAALKNATEEEKEMLVEVEISSEDGYEELKYCFTQKQLKMLDEIKKFQEDCARKIENDIKRSQDDCGLENGDGDESEIQ